MSDVQVGCACLWRCHALAADSALCVCSHRAGRHAGGDLRPGEADHRGAVGSLHLGSVQGEVMKTAAPPPRFDGRVDLQTSPPPRLTLHSPHQRRSGRPEFSLASFLFFLPDKTSCLGFLTSRAKHTGSLMTSHSTRYSSLMFKGGEL